MSQLPHWRAFGIITPREARLASLAIAFFVLILALTPGHPGLNALFGWDKIDHIAAFAALTLIIRSGWPNWNKIITALILIGYGGLIEWAQTLPFVSRTFSVFDILADIIGIIIGFILARLCAVLFARMPWVIHRPKT